MWTPLTSMINHNELQLSKPYLNADGGNVQCRKEASSILRRCVFIIGTAMTVDSTEMPIVTVCCIFLVLSFLQIIRGLIAKTLSGEMTDIDSTELISPSSTLHRMSPDNLTNSISNPNSDNHFGCLQRNSINLRCFYATNVAILTFSFLYTTKTSIPTQEICFMLMFSIVNDMDNQQMIMKCVQKVRPYSYDGLIDYVILGVMICIEFCLCSRLFIHILYNSYGIVAICLSYCNAFASVMEFTTRVTTIMRTELSLVSALKRASRAELDEYNDICAICLNRMESARLTPCRHIFHGKCLRLSLRNNVNCPLCQSKMIVTQNSGHSINAFWVYSCRASLLRTQNIIIVLYLKNRH